MISSRGIDTTGHVLAKVEVSPLKSLITNSFRLNNSIVPVVALFKGVTFSALPILRVMTLLLIDHVPWIVPVTPWLRVLLMNPPGRTLETNVPSAPNEIVSFASPTVPIQSPRIVSAYCASWMGAPSRAQDAKPNSNASASRLNRIMFMRYCQQPERSKLR